MSYKRLSSDNYITSTSTVEFLCDTLSDLSELSDVECNPGSTAIVLESQEIYMLNNQHQWVIYQSLKGGSGGGGGGSDVEIATLEEFIEYLNTEAEDGGTE